MELREGVIETERFASENPSRLEPNEYRVSFTGKPSPIASSSWPQCPG